jgi:hypothetical protein
VQHETVAGFLARVVPSRTEQTLNCQWIYLEAEASHRACERTVPDVYGYEQAAAPLVQRWEGKLQTQARVSNEEKAQFMRELYALATRYRVVSGKWMLFPQKDYVDADWAKVAVATAEGSLGVSSKVSPALNVTDSLLICVYCNDFNDRADCERVLKRLRTLGLRSTSFKPDALTHLNLYADDLKRLKLHKSWQLHKDLVDASPSTATWSFLAPPSSANPSSLSWQPVGGANTPTPPLPADSATIDFAALRREREARHAVSSSSPLPAPVTSSVPTSGAVESNGGAVSGGKLAFHLLRSAALAAPANEASVTLRELAPEKGCLRAVVFSMMIDWEFLRQEVPALSQVEDLTVIYTEGELKCTQNLPPWARRYEPPVPKFGVHHSKGFLLWYRDPATGTRSLRVVITTANFLYSDIHAKTNGVWCAVALEKRAASACELEDDLVAYFECYNKNGRAVVDTQSIREFDFSPFRGVKLIASVPGPTEHGVHYGEALFRWGHMALRAALNKHCTKPVTQETRIVSQFTSLGRMDEKWLTREFADSLVGARLERTCSGMCCANGTGVCVCEIRGYANPHGRSAGGADLLQLVVPTAEQVRVHATLCGRKPASCGQTCFRHPCILSARPRPNTCVTSFVSWPGPVGTLLYRRLLRRRFHTHQRGQDQQAMRALEAASIRRLGPVCCGPFTVNATPEELRAVSRRTLLG